MVARNREYRIQHNPTLRETKLVSLHVERHKNPQDAPNGKFLVSMNSAVSLDSNGVYVICETSVMANGISHDTDEPAFTTKCTMSGTFELKEKIKDNVKLDDESVLLLSNFIVPIIAETIELHVLKIGFGNVSVPRSFENNNIEANKKENE